MLFYKFIKCVAWQCQRQQWLVDGIKEKIVFSWKASINEIREISVDKDLKSGDTDSSSSYSVIQRDFGVQKVPNGEVWSGVHEFFSKLKMLEAVPNLSDRKGLISVILAPWTVRKKEVVPRSYEGLKIPNKLQKWTFDSIWLMKNFIKKNITLNLIFHIVYWPIIGCHVAYPEAAMWPQAEQEIGMEKICLSLRDSNPGPESACKGTWPTRLRFSP